MFILCNESGHGESHPNPLGSRTNQTEGWVWEQSNRCWSFPLNLYFSPQNAAEKEFFFLKRLQSNTSQDYEMSPKKYDSKSLLHISCVFLNFAWPPRRRHVRLIQINFPNRVLIQNNFPPVWAPWAHCGGQVGSFCMKWLVGWST